MKNYTFSRSPGLKATENRRSKAAESRRSKAAESRRSRAGDQRQSKLNRALGTKSDSNDEGNNKPDSGFFFFDIDYSNRIINVDLEINKQTKEDLNLLNYQKRAKKAKMAKFEKVIRRQQYGNKWYVLNNLFLITCFNNLINRFQISY